jgi:CRISPR associated protein Cas1
MLHDSATADAIARFRLDLPSAEGIETVRLFESQAARAYWQAWSDLPIRWARKDEPRVPAHWKFFGSRISSLTHSPRLAANPPNALLNLLYTFVESESRLSAAAMGLDPGIGVLHVDTPNRDSLACDLMEVCRPKVDAFVLHWLQSEPLCKSDFWEDRNGNCRLVSALAIKLAQTSHTWSKLVAPIAEYVAQALWSSIPKTASPPKLTQRLIATRLTQRNKREVKGSDVAEVESPKPEHGCSGCGKPIRADRSHCASCAGPEASKRMIEIARLGRIATHSPEAEALRATTRRRHAAALKSWQPSEHPSWLTEDAYLKRIQPLLRDATVSAIASALSISLPYATQIRKGNRRPHPRHWQTLAGLVRVMDPDV